MLAVLLALQVAAPADSFVLGPSFTLRSARLGEPRRVAVGLPAGYAAARQHYPVLVVLDGEGPFLEAVAASRLLAEAGEMPPVIVVGVWNGDRNRDFTPALPPGAPPPGLPAWGGMEPFLGFLAEELAPAVDARYRTASLRVLTGFSLGGLVAVEAVLRSPTAYPFALALDPSLWWEGRAWAARTPDRLAAARGARRLVTVEAAEGWRETWPRLEAAARGPVRVVRVRSVGDSHGAMHYKGIYDGLRALFADYAAAARGNGPVTLASLEARYHALGETYGYDVAPPVPALVRVAERLLGAGDVGQARDVIGRLESLVGADWQVRRLRTRADSLAGGAGTSGRPGPARP